jgi:hypothetical protein
MALTMGEGPVGPDQIEPFERECPHDTTNVASDR